MTKKRTNKIKTTIHNIKKKSKKNKIVINKQLNYRSESILLHNKNEKKKESN